MNEPAYRRITQDYAERIGDGRLPPGTRLHSVGDMAAEHGVSEIVIRRVITELGNRGLVRTVPRKGAYVADHPPTGKQLHHDQTTEPGVIQEWGIRMVTVTGVQTYHRAVFTSQDAAAANLAGLRRDIAARPDPITAAELVTRKVLRGPWVPADGLDADEPVLLQWDCAFCDEAATSVVHRGQTRIGICGPQHLGPAMGLLAGQDTGGDQ